MERAGIPRFSNTVPDSSHRFDVFGRLHQGLRLRQTGNRILAFYLTEMDARGLHQAAGHPTTAHYAEAVLEMDRRRVQELLVVGRKLL